MKIKKEMKLTKMKMHFLKNEKRNKINNSIYNNKANKEQTNNDSIYIHYFYDVADVFVFI